MKIKLVFLILIAFSFESQAQRKSTLDFVVGGEYSYRMLFYEKGLGKGWRQSETGLIKARVGLDYNRNFKDNWYFKTGLRYFKAGYRTKENDAQDVLIVIDGVIVESYHFETDLSVIEVPINFRYEYSDAKFAPYVEFGFTPSLMLKGKSIVIGNTISKTFDYDWEDFNRFLLVGNLAFGVNYSLNEKMLIFTHPIVRLQVNSINKKGFIHEHLLNYGLEIGVRRVL